jgi:hypothetical protein
MSEQGPRRDGIRAGEVVHGVARLPAEGGAPVARARKRSRTARRVLLAAFLVVLTGGIVYLALPSRPRQPVAVLPGSTHYGFVSLAFSPDGTTLAGGCKGPGATGGRGS